MFYKMFSTSFFYETEEALSLGFLSSSNFWEGKKSILLLEEEQTWSLSPALTREATVNGKIQTFMNK